MKIDGIFDSDDIQYLLKKKKLTQKDLAAKFGVTEMAISKVINFKMTSERLMKAISRELGVPYKTLFARYYQWAKRRPRNATPPC